MKKFGIFRRGLFLISLSLCAGLAPLFGDGGQGGNAGGGAGGTGFNGQNGSDGVGTLGGGGGGGGAGGGSGGQGVRATGGAGGAGGTAVSPNGQNGGNGNNPEDAGGGGGGGWNGNGITGTATLNNSTPLAGGNGGAGGEGFFTAGTPLGGGGGGAGGYGAIVTGDGTHSNSSTISGGNGGNGGNGGAGVPGAGDGGGGGDGGVGVFFTNAGAITFTNSGTIAGGNGGAVGLGGGRSPGVGGIGVMGGSNFTLTNSGTISGGFHGGSATRANAVLLTGNNHTVTIQNNGAFNGNVQVMGTNNVLAFTGTGSFTPASIGSQFLGFSEVQIQSGTRTFTDAPTFSIPTLISSGANLRFFTDFSGLNSAITNNGQLTALPPVDVTFGQSIGGTGLLRKENTSTLTLTGTNTYSGDTTVAVGTLVAANNSALGTTAAGTTVLAGATLGLTGGITIAEDITLNGTGVSGGGALRNVSGNNTVSGQITLASASRIESGAETLFLTGGITGADQNLTLGGDGDISVSSAIATGTGSLTKDGPGVVALSGTNTFTGEVNVTGGSLQLIGGSALADAVRVQVDAGSTLQVANSETLGNISGAGGISLGGAFVPVTLIVGDATDSTFSGVINQNGVVGSLVKQGTGTLTLSGNNTYSGGTMLSAGTLGLGNNNALGTGTLTIGDGTTLATSGGTRTIANNVVINGDFNRTGAGGETLSFNGNVDLGNGVRRIANTSGSNLRFLGAISGTGGITIGAPQSSAVVFGGTTSNTYTGLTTVETGAQLILDKTGGATAIAGDLVIEAGGGVELFVSHQIADSAQLTVNGTLTFEGASETVGSLFGSGKIEELDSDSTFTVGSGDFSGVIEIDVRLVKATSGTLTLSGANTYERGTTISGGTLLVNNTTGSGTGFGAVAVQNGATLGGTGIIGGVTTVADGGILAPGTSPGTLTFDNNLILNNTSILDYELDTPNVVGGGINDLTVVNGNLTLDGILHITDLGGFGDGTYRLFNYTGSLTNNGLVFGTLPAGLWELSVNTATANQVNLLVTAATEQFWDGANTTPNGMVDGGTGTWNGTTTNWTNSTGTANNAWAGGLTAIFDATPGTVTIADGFTANAAGYQFRVGGYSLVADGTGQIQIDAATPFFTDAGTTTISAPIVGTGSLQKQGDGSLVLLGTNTFAGGTLLSEGFLLLGNNNSLGAGTLTISEGVTIGAVPGAFLSAANNVEIAGDFQASVGNGDQLDFGGTTNLGTGVRTITLLGEGLFCFSGVVTAGDGLMVVLGSSTTSGAFSLCGPGDNTFGGTLTIGSGVEFGLEKNTGAIAVPGNLVIEEGGVAAILGGMDQIAETSTVTVDGSLGFTNFFGSNTARWAGLFGESSGIIENDLTAVVLEVGGGSFSGTIQDGGAGGEISLVKFGSDTLVLASANSYVGGTSIENGTLQTLNSSALGTGGVSLEGGTLDPVGTLNISSLTWNGGTIASEVGTTTDLVSVSGGLTLDPSGGMFEFTEGTGFAPNRAYHLLSAANLSAGMLSIFSGNTLLGLSPVFSLDGMNLLVNFAGATTGPLLQNTGPVFTPTDADFVVNGPVQTGGPNDSNTVRSLTFNPSSSLRVSNNLTVSSGNFLVGGWTGTISGGNVIVPGAFQKLGEGTLIANSNFQIGGAGTINSGALFVNGNFSVPGGLTVFQNALLGGSGTIFGNVFNQGTVNPGNSPGTLTISGNYTQASSGTLQIEIASPSVFDRLIVSGTASLDGTLQVLNVGRKLKYGQRYAFLQAGRITGEFDRILMPQPSKFRGRFLAESGIGTLLVAPTSYTLVAETTNQRNVAKALDSYIPARDNDRETVSIALDSLTEEQYPAAFDQIAPGFYESLTQITISQAFVQTQMINQRLGSVRLGAAGGFQAIGLGEQPLRHDKDGKSVVDPKDGKAIIQLPESLNWSAWAMGNGIFAKATPANSLPSYRYETGGFLAGVDYVFGGRERLASGDPVLTAGLYGGYNYTAANYANGSFTEVNSALFGGYATYSHGGFYADSVIGGGYNGYRARRSIEFGSIDRTARSTPSGGMFNAAINLGYDIQISGFTLGPIIGLQYTYAGVAPFTEEGADSLDLRLSQQNANSLIMTLGGRVAYTWKIGENIRLIPEVRVFWQHEFLENPAILGASLDGGAGPGFDYHTETPDRDSLFTGAGISAQFGDRWNAYFFYNSDFASQDFLSHAISAGLGWSF